MRKASTEVSVAAGLALVAAPGAGGAQCRSAATIDTVVIESTGLAPLRLAAGDVTELAVGYRFGTASPQSGWGLGVRKGFWF